jgi:hypothetical protein
MLPKQKKKQNKFVMTLFAIKEAGMNMAPFTDLY